MNTSEQPQPSRPTTDDLLTGAASPVPNVPDVPLMPALPLDPLPATFVVATASSIASDLPDDLADDRSGVPPALIPALLPDPLAALADPLTCTHQIAQSADYTAFVSWIAHLVHYTLCADCRHTDDQPPAPDARCVAVLQVLSADPLYRQMLRRLGGFMAPPSIMRNELDVLTLLREDRESVQADRLRRYLWAKGALHHPTTTAETFTAAAHAAHETDPT